MNFTKAITPTITIADQPTEDDLGALSGEGYTGVVNLRHDGEPEQPLGVSEEAEHVKALGMEYQHLGVGGAPLTKEGVDAVCNFIDQHTDEGKKVLVHCRKGGRAAALVFLQHARKHGWGPDDVGPKSAELGIAVEGNLRQMVEDYLHREGNSA